MRIGIDIRATQLGSATRGIGKYIYDLVEGVTRYAPHHEYVYIVLPDRPLPERLLPIISRYRTAPLPTRLLGDFPIFQRVRYLWRFNYLKARREHSRALAKLAGREKLDVLHQPCAVDFNFFPSCRPSCRFVQTFYDAAPDVLPEFYLSQWPEAMKFVYRLQMKDCQRADAVVAISESARQDGIRYAKIPADKMDVVYAVVSNEFRPVTDESRLRECFARLGVTPPYFLFCSAPDETKNIIRLVEAFAEFTGWPEPHQLVMVSRKTKEVLSHAFELGLSNRQLLYTGFVSDEDLVTLYSGATALVSPSLHEGFGLPAGQAMRAGTPAIVSDRSSQPEVVGDAGLLVDPYDSHSIADAMRRIAGDSKLRADLRERGLKRVHRFDWQTQAAALLDIYAGHNSHAKIAGSQRLASASAATESSG